MSLSHDIQAILTGVPAKYLIESDASLRRLETQAWAHPTDEDLWDKYVAALVRAGRADRALTVLAHRTVIEPDRNSIRKLLTAAHDHQYTILAALHWPNKTEDFQRSLVAITGLSGKKIYANLLRRSGMGQYGMWARFNLMENADNPDHIDYLESVRFYVMPNAEIGDHIDWRMRRAEDDR